MSEGLACFVIYRALVHPSRHPILLWKRKAKTSNDGQSIRLTDVHGRKGASKGDRAVMRAPTNKETKKQGVKCCKATDKQHPRFLWRPTCYHASDSSSTLIASSNRVLPQQSDYIRRDPVPFKEHDLVSDQAERLYLSREDKSQPCRNRSERPQRVSPLSSPFWHKPKYLCNSVEEAGR